jgi:hypothetical protein
MGYILTNHLPDRPSGPRLVRTGGRMRHWVAQDVGVEEDTMGKTGRKRRARKKKGANHGKRPNA